MRRHWKKLAVLAAVAVAAAGILFTLSSGPPEPSYEGRSLSEWIAGLEQQQYMRQVYTAETQALIHMGTNSLPFLVKWACHRPPKWRRAILDFCYRHPGVPAILQDWAEKDGRRALCATYAFALLRTNAFPALSELLQIATTSHDAGVVRSAEMTMAMALFGGTGKYDVLADMTFIRSPNPVVRQAGTNAYEYVREHAPVLPPLSGRTGSAAPVAATYLPIAEPQAEPRSSDPPPASMWNAPPMPDEDPDPVLRMLRARRARQIEAERREQEHAAPPSPVAPGGF